MSDEPLVASSTVEEQAPPPEKLTGISVYPGIAYGLCQQFSAGDLEIPQFVIEKTGTRGEIQRLRAAIATVDKQLGALIDSADEDMPAEAAAFIDVHRTILRDPTLIEETVDIIKEKLVNAEWALSLRLEKTRRDFESIEDDYIRERIKDIAHVVLRVQRVLTGRRSASSLLEAEGLDETIILVADQLDPADMLLLRGRDDLDIAGIILEEGSITSHAVILARSLEIPTLVGVKGACEILETDVPVLLNADEELIDLSPSAEKRRNARQRMKLLTAEKKRLKKLKQFDAVTLDGHTIKLFANIALPEDVKDVHRAGADGVGLFRTEFLFMNRDDLPCEDEQYNAYCRVIRSMKGQPVVIRTADLGGDKVMSQDALEKLTTGPLEELNPSLGLRGLRFCFAHPKLFVTQLRAILRAAAVMMLKDLIPVLDFFSLGTNDLVQYTLAVDRTNAAVSKYYDECHPSVLRMIATTVRQVHQAGKSVSVCGEMAARPELVPFFIGLGCTRLSMTLTQIPAIKKRILKTDRAKAEVFAASVLRRRSAKAVHQSFIQEEEAFQNRKVADPSTTL